MSARTHLEAVFRHQSGWVFIGIGTGQYLAATGKVRHENWVERSFRWPTQADETIDEITSAVDAGADVYFTPSLSANPVREKPKDTKHGRRPRPVHCMWADLDDNYNRVHLSQLRGRGGCWLVASGSRPDRCHLYVPLVEPAAPDVAADLLRRLAAYLGADPAPAWHGAYLRPAGTKNWKPAVLTGELPGEVRFEDGPCQAAWTVDDLDHLLPAVEHTSPVWDIPDAEPVDDHLPGWLEDVISEPVTVGMDRSKRTMAAVGACRRADLTDGEVITVMRRHQPTIEKYNGRADAEVARILAKTPPRVDADHGDHHRNDDADHDRHHGDGEGHQHLELALADGHRPTDVGNADRLATLADGHIRYVHAWQKWIVYRGGAWRIDAGDALITELAKGVPRNMFRRAAELGGEQRDAMWKWAKRSETTPSIRAMIHLARGIPGVLIDHTQLDQRPWLLNVANGTIDLRTGRLLDHNPEHLLSKTIPITYDPTNKAPKFTKFLERIVPDDDVRSYLHRFVGYTATGLIREHVFPIWWGDGSNGKSTLIGLIRSALGDYAISAARDLFMASKYESHDTKYADLFGRRLATRTETRDGGNLDEARVKELTGGDPMKGRRMREDYWEFQPSHKLVLATNHKPRIEGTDHAIWRRVHLVPFTQKIVEPELDPELPEKLEAELPGILAWIVQGCLAWQRNGLAVPKMVVAATDRYRNESDLVARFMSECGVESTQTTGCGRPNSSRPTKPGVERTGSGTTSNTRQPANASELSVPEPARGPVSAAGRASTCPPTHALWTGGDRGPA